MTTRQTISITSDPEFLAELSDYLEILSNPIRLKILKFIEHEPKEIAEIADHIGATYQNTKKHLDRLVACSLVKRGAGFSRETERGIAPVWKYSVAEGGLAALVDTMGTFSSVAVPLGYQEIRKRIDEVRSAVSGNEHAEHPVLFAIGGPLDGHAFALIAERTALGRMDPDAKNLGGSDTIVLPEEYVAVTRVTRPHAYIIHGKEGWSLEDSGSRGGTYLNSQRLVAHEKAPVAHGDVIDLSLGAHAARFLFIFHE